MSIRCGFLALCLLGLCPCVSVFGQSVSNPNATFSMMDGPSIRLAPQATIDPLFHVRIVDAHGAPIPGLVVEFFPDMCATIGGAPNTCTPPDLYGTFVDPLAAAHVVTDENGIAAAPAFVAGPAAAIYDVAAFISIVDYPQNAVIGFDLALDLEVEQIALNAPIRITSAFTGTWYDPNQSGHGLMLEVLGDNRLLAYWFAFDQFAQQAWFGGVGNIENDLAIVNVDQGIGGAWIPNFDPANYRLYSWGTLMFQFSDCNHGRVDFAANASMESAFGFGHMDLTRITMPARLSCD